MEWHLHNACKGTSMEWNVSRSDALHCAGVFSAGVPTAFQANYVASVGLLEGLEALCPTQQVPAA